MKTTGNAVFNPHDRPVDGLPVIFGYSHGGLPGDMVGILIAQDGAMMGSHVSSNEGFMPGDLGVLKDSRPDRHEDFREHYPKGYRMEFVSREEMEKGHAGVKAAQDLYVRGVCARYSRGPEGGEGN